MKGSNLFLLILIFVSVSHLSFGQNSHIGEGFSKSNKKSIDRKMHNLISRIAEELECPQDSIEYNILENYTTFYTSSKRHLPKSIKLEGCGSTVIYNHNGLSGAVLYWLLGSWVREKS